MDIWIYEYILYGYMYIYIYESLETLETHDIYDTPDIGTLNLTDRVSQ